MPRVGRAIALGAVPVISLLLLTIAVSVFWLHLAVRPVLSPSMRPAFAPGWAIVTRTEPVSALRPGQVVVFRPPGMSTAYAHRVTSVTNHGGHVIITTKGDANTAPDPWHAQLEGRTVPKVVYAVPLLGHVMVGLESKQARAVLVLVAGLFIGVGGTRAIARNGRRSHVPASSTPATASPKGELTRWVGTGLPAAQPARAGDSLQVPSPRQPSPLPVQVFTQH